MPAFSSLIRKHWLVITLTLVVVYLLLRPQLSPQLTFKSKSSPMMAETASFARDMVAAPAPVPPTEQKDRLIITDTSLSLVVKDVNQSLQTIESTATQLGGFLVNSQLSRPEGASSGTITVRVPTAKRAEALIAFKGLAVKTVSENVYGQDVTDQYVDLVARLDVLLKTKAKFESILDRATQVQDLLSVQRELINLQAEIDALKGQQHYLEKSAQLSRITVYLSTDELALPYTPDQPWSPSVIFKTAVRALITVLRSAGTLVIWLTVFAPFWAPALLLIKWYRKRSQSRHAP